VVLPLELLDELLLVLLLVLLLDPPSQPPLELELLLEPLSHALNAINAHSNPMKSISVFFTFFLLLVWLRVDWKKSS
jgi:hypothetical protein